jgi:hypothetical protein
LLSAARHHRSEERLPQITYQSRQVPSRLPYGNGHSPRIKAVQLEVFAIPRPFEAGQKLVFNGG